MEFLNGPQLFDSMFAEDPDAEKLALLPGMEALLKTYPYYEWQNIEIKPQMKAILNNTLLNIGFFFGIEVSLKNL